MTIQILDGGLGTSLEDKYGVQFTHSNPLWSSHFLVEGNDTLEACQRDFCAAGVDVLLTATYQVSIEGFKGTKTKEYPDGIGKEAISSYLRNAVDIADRARQGARKEVKLALGVGPYGACMVPGQEYSGKYDEKHDDEESLFQWHLERLKLFTGVEGLVERAQYIAFETLPRKDEILAVRKAIHAAGIKTTVSETDEKRFWISCVFPGEGDGLPDGSTIEQAVEAMLDVREGAALPWGIGINCTKIHKLPALIEKFEKAITVLRSQGRIQASPALVLYPDGTNGEVYNTTTKKWEKPQEQAIDERAKVSVPL